MAKRENKLLQLLIDIPEEEVIFGFNEYASVLISAIVGTEPRFTIGIFGKWGSGKTTLLRKIEAQLKDKYSGKVITVSFDAWRYQHEEHMILPLLDTISNSLKQGETHWKTLNNNIRHLTGSVTKALTLKAPGMQLEMGKAVEHWQQQAEQIRSDYYGWLTDLQKALNEAREGDPQRRIVIIIDDLDRCLPHKVVEVLESIKVMLDVSGFIFVLALDRFVVEKAIENHYGENYGIQGKDYIKKLVQVDFSLPPLRSQDVAEYTRMLQEKLGKIEGEVSATLAEVVPSVVGDNPREVKRFINRVLLSSAIIKNAGITVLVRHQVAFMAMEFQWPEIMRILAD
ncbi:MAG: KAP family P-loop NTPase fold protein, partial [Candidatus Baldrarchaeia archaeon]